MENVREELDRLIRQRNVGYSAVSRLLNRNPAYIQQFIKRGSPRKLDDDNLASGFKAVRDGVADWLGIDDGSPRICWQYAQEKSKAGEYAARVHVSWVV